MTRPAQNSVERELQQFEHELAALNAVVNALKPLDAPARGRVVRYVIERFHSEPALPALCPNCENA